MEIVIILAMVIGIGAYFMMSRKKAVPPACEKIKHNQKITNTASENAELIDKAMQQEAINIRKLALESLSPEESQCLTQVSALLAKLSPTSDSNAAPAREKLIMNLFFQTRAIAELRHGDEVCRTNFGDELINNSEYMAPRLKAGLSVDDVRNYWNQPLLKALLIPEVHLLSRSLYEEDSASNNQKTSALATERRFRHSNVVYGNPVADAERLLEMEGFTHDDAALFIEFYSRINQWQDKLPPLSKQEAIRDSASSLNAKIRSLITEAQI